MYLNVGDYVYEVGQTLCITALHDKCYRNDI